MQITASQNHKAQAHKLKLTNHNLNHNLNHINPKAKSKYFENEQTVYIHIKKKTYKTYTHTHTHRHTHEYTIHTCLILGMRMVCYILFKFWL